MAHWLRYEHEGEIGFGTVDDGVISVHDGDMFNAPIEIGKNLPLESVTPLIPTVPSKLIGLWNNLRAQSEKLELPTPGRPWYFIKTPNTYLATGGTVRRPPFHDGKIIFEAEIGIVIGRTCFGVSGDQADDYIFGYTCVNDVTAIQILKEEPFFEHWTRAKCFDTFGPFGPVIATGLDPDQLVIRGILNGVEYQSYPVSDMFFSPRQLVSLISHDMSLFPGDMITCGTSLGSKVMRDPTNTIEIAIDGIGTLSNVFE